MATRPRTTRKRRRAPKQSRSVRTFNIVAIVIVFALVVGAIGAAVVDAWLFRDDDSSITIDPEDSEDPVEQQYRDSIEENPENTAAMSALAEYLARDGRINEAIEWYEKALAIAPDDMDMRLTFAGDLTRAGKHRDAELQFIKVIEAEPDNAFALLGLARLYRSWAPPRLEDAITYYQLAVDKAGDSVVHDVAAEELAQISGTPVASPDASPSPAA